MNILLAASEVVPYAKTGGLADVAGALPKELTRLGNTVRVVMPRYKLEKIEAIGDTHHRHITERRSSQRGVTHQKVTGRIFS